VCDSAPARRYDQSQTRYTERSSTAPTAAGLPGAGDDRESEHEERIREERAQERRLRNDHLVRVEREEDDRDLGDVPERRLKDAGRRRPDPLAERLGREGDRPGETR